MTTIYLAARYSRREELCVYAKTLEALGHRITSRWLNGTHESRIPDDQLHLPQHRELAAGFATEDINDVYNAHMFIAFTEPPLPFASRGGRHVEAGIATALGKRIIVCGPLENVFYCLPTVVHVDDFAGVLAALGGA